MSSHAYYGHLTSLGRSEMRGEKNTQYFSVLLLQPIMRIAIRDTYKALQTLKFCMHIRWGCAAISQKRAAFSQASKAMLVFTEIMSILYKYAAGIHPKNLKIAIARSLEIKPNFHVTSAREKGNNTKIHTLLIWGFQNQTGKNGAGLLS